MQEIDADHKVNTDLEYVGIEDSLTNRGYIDSHRGWFYPKLVGNILLVNDRIAERNSGTNLNSVLADLKACGYTFYLFDYPDDLLTWAMK